MKKGPFIPIILFLTVGALAVSNSTVRAQTDQASLLLDLKKAKAAYDIAKQNFENDKKLFDNKAISENQYNQSRNELLSREVDYQKLILQVMAQQAYIIVEKAIKYGTVSTIFIHNHPSGDPTPSKSDKQFTRDLVFIGELIQISVLDHIVIGGNRYFSFADEGLIEKYRFDFLNFKIRRVSDSKLTSI